MTDPLTSALWASTAMVVYALISLRVGDWFPFSKYSMYAALSGRVTGAVLYVEADGQPANIVRLDQFSGIDPGHIDPKGHPCSQQWVVWETQRWVAEHLDPNAPGEVDVEIGFRLVTVEQFRLSETRVALARGRACWRRR